MRLSRILLLIIFLIALAPTMAQAQTSTPPPEIQRILNSMSPEERVGQLFIVTFTGTDVSPTSQIYTLITRYHIGGVATLAQNDNFAPPETDALAQTRALIENLQRVEWDVSVNPVVNPVADPVTGEKIKSTYEPLFIGITQEGNGYPTDQILNGLTPLPSEMAIGATWNTEIAARVGETRGRELSALGFNLYFGPSLDVLDAPSVSGGDLGTRVFGGDPFWVGEMGRAYVAGLHNGSANQLLVIAKHFPGVGGSDRLPEEEVSTVRKSIEQLKQIELAPFFAVTGNAPTPEATVDGLLVSHIRYQGFQGNIRATTRPISFDAQALNQILALPQLATWHSAGGLMISDDLGTRAVSEFYASGGGKFSARTAARDAFLAGNDMLYLGNITSNDAANAYAATINVIEFFTQKYREDPAFAQRVDSSVARILAAKLKLYGDFALAKVIAPTNLSAIGAASDVTFDAARHSATLISPDRQDLAAVMPLPPKLNESMVFVTDAQNVKQCAACKESPALAVDALQQAVLRLYGPQSGNQTANFRLASYSLQNLQALLDNQNPAFIEDDLTRANWIVISLRDAAQGQPALITRFLRERPDLLREKRVVLFSFGAPYYFDTTAISKFTAYFALYSKQPQFVDVAARLLFQELAPVGSSPVSIPGIGYDLISVTAPDPQQIIPLFLDLAPTAVVAMGTLTTPEPTPIPLFKIGDTIAIRTGVIKDHNGRPVPDGTVVQFSTMLTGEGGGILKQTDATTAQGVARAAFGLDKHGLLEIRAASEPAVISETLQLDVSQSGAVAVTVIVPELTQPTEPPPEAPVAAKDNGYISKQGVPRFSAWFLAMLLIALSAWIVYVAGLRLAENRAATRWALGITLGGLSAYNVLVFGLFGVANWLIVSGVSGAFAFVFFGELLGFAAGWAWSKK